MAASYTRWRDVADGEGGLTRYPVAAMTASGFDVTGVEPLRGRALAADDEEIGAIPVVVISARVWRSLFGAESGAVGRTVNVDGLDRTGRAVTRTAVYVTLTRLEKRGLVSSRMGDPTPERGGKAKRYFRVEPQAIRAVKATKAALVSMWDGVEAIRRASGTGRGTLPGA